MFDHLYHMADFSVLFAVHCESQQPGLHDPGKKEHTMKSLKQQLMAVAIFAALACTGLHAQSLDMRATIPFDFHAGDRLMPAGEYIIHENGPVVFLREADSGRPAPILLTIGADRLDSQEAHLEFNHYGSEYFLTAVWNSFTRDGRRMLPTNREKELAKRGDVPLQTTVALARSK
jgi:hypothetical protein